MRLIQRYLLREFIPVFLVALFFFVLMLELSDLFFNLWKYLSFNVSALSILHVMALYFPKCVSFAMPIAVLFASSYTIGTFYARNELIAVFSSGVPLFVLTAPLMLMGILLSLGMFFFEDRMVISTQRDKNVLTRTLFQQEESKSTTNVVFLADSGRQVYVADYYQDNEQRLYSLLVVGRHEDLSLDYVLQTPEAGWNGSQWVYQSYSLHTVAPDGSIRESSGERRVELIEPPDSFRRSSVTVDELHAEDAKVYIESLRKSGLSYTEQLSNYYKRFSFPCTIFIVLFFSIPLSGRFKKNIILMSLLMSLCVGVLFYVIQMISMLLAKSEYISPLAGAWFPVVLFICAGGFILKNSRT
jgi:lipopolysaccharide export system permease protein